MSGRHPRSAGTPSARRVLMLPVYPFNPYQRLLAAALGELGVEVQLLSEWPRRSAFLGAWLANGRPRTVHLHWVQDFLGGGRGLPTRRNLLWFDWQLRLLALFGVRIVWTAHNLRSHGGAGHPREREAYRRLARRAHAVIAHCQAGRQAVQEAYELTDREADRVHVIPHGSYVGHYAVDLDPAESRRRLGIASEARVIVFVGSIRGYKSVADLVEAFKRLPGTSPQDRLLVCGKCMSNRTRLDLERRAADDPRIVLRLERLAEDEISTVLRAADVAVLPFADILTSGSVILAMSHARPVVAPAMGCLPETVPSDAGILYDPDAPDALLDALRQALQSDLAAMGRRAREVADTLDWKAIAARTAALYADG